MVINVNANVLNDLGRQVQLELVDESYSDGWPVHKHKEDGRLWKAGQILTLVEEWLN